MTYRVDARRAPDGIRLEVQGLLDAEALEDIREALRTGRDRLHVVLKEGCTVQPAVLAELRRLDGVELVAESPYLARWLASM